MADEPLPKQVLLIKLMKMTTSTNDGEALTALRKANELLSSAGWDWERLIQQKIVIVGDPFATLATPTAHYEGNGSTPQPSTGRAPSPPPRPKTVTWPLGTLTNRFAGHCWCCGIEVIATAGKIFRPSDHVLGAFDQNKFQVVCNLCNPIATPGVYAATPVRTRRKASVVDLA